MDKTIGKLAKAAKVNVQTIRYYERRGILTPEDRRESGYRVYGEGAVRRLLFIKNAQALGFTLDEVALLLRLRVRHRGQCEPVKRQALARLEIVRRKIAALKAMESALRRLLKTCAARGTTGSCPLMESLDSRR